MKAQHNTQWVDCMLLLVTLILGGRQTEHQHRHSPTALVLPMFEGSAEQAADIRPRQHHTKQIQDDERASLTNFGGHHVADELPHQGDTNGKVNTKKERKEKQTPPPMLEDTM